MQTGSVIGYKLDKSRTSFKPWYRSDSIILNVNGSIYVICQDVRDLSAL